MNKMITLGAGCFWGTQAYFDLIPGIIDSVVGYANGNKTHVSYEQVCQGNTGFIEVCQITYNSDMISLDQILTHFWKIIDPTLVNQQAHDYGSQYQSAILYQPSNETVDLPVILKSKTEQQTFYSQPITTVVEPLKMFIMAEKYHQKYLQKNPGGYCHIKLPK